MLVLLKKNYFKHQETIHNFLWRSLQIFGKQGITFLIFILCAKLLTPYDFGIYNYILAVVFFLIIFGDFGISTATSKFVAEFNATDKEKLRKVLFNALILIFCFGVSISLIVFLLGEYFLKEKFVFVLYALPLLFLAPITSLYDGVFRGLKRFKELAFISVAIGFFSIFFVYYLVNEYGLIGALISQNLFYLLLVLVLAIRYGNLYLEFDKGLIKQVLSYSTIIGLSSFGFYLYSKSNILILGYFDYIEEINAFELVTKVTVLLSTAFSIMGQITAPNITALMAKNKKDIVFRKFIKYIIFGFLISLIISIFVYFLLPVFIKIYFPHLFTVAFVEVFNVLIWIMPFVLISGMISQGFTVATGNAKIGLLTIPFGILNVIVGLVFVKIFGYIGIAYGTLIVSLLNKIISWSILYKKL